MGSNGEGKWKQRGKPGRIRWSGRMSSRPNYLALAAGVIFVHSDGVSKRIEEKIVYVKSFELRTRLWLQYLSTKFGPS